MNHRILEAVRLHLASLLPDASRADQVLTSLTLQNCAADEERNYVRGETLFVLKSRDASLTEQVRQMASRFDYLLRDWSADERALVRRRVAKSLSYGTPDVTTIYVLRRMNGSPWDPRVPEESRDG